MAFDVAPVHLAVLLRRVRHFCACRARFVRGIAQRLRRGRWYVSAFERTCARNDVLPGTSRGGLAQLSRKRPGNGVLDSTCERAWGVRLQGHMGLRRARRAHAPDGPAWNLSPRLSRRPSNRAVCAGDWASRPTGMLSVKSHHVACEAWSRCPCLRACPLPVFARFAGWGDMQRLDSAS